MSSLTSGEAKPEQGEIWDVDLDPTIGREQAGVRPALVVSDSALNRSPRGLVIVLPITGTDRRFPTHVPIGPPEGGLTKPSVIMTEGIRSISKERLIGRRGVASTSTMSAVKETMRIVLDL